MIDGQVVHGVPQAHSGPLAGTDPHPADAPSLGNEGMVGNKTLSSFVARVFANFRAFPEGAGQRVVALHPPLEWWLGDSCMGAVTPVLQLACGSRCYLEGTAKVCPTGLGLGRALGL